jgi:CheY-like chemotaxis protein
MPVETILVVEDEGLIALHISEILEKAGYRVVGPHFSGETVLEYLETAPLPDLILMDIVLAGKLDGIEVAREIAQKFLVPIIFVTAHSPDKIHERMTEMVPDGVIVKPFLDDDLLATIGKILGSPKNHHN